MDDSLLQLVMGVAVVMAVLALLGAAAAAFGADSRSGYGDDHGLPHVPDWG
jgi:hypothetical protein